ncbi:MAG: gliding motility-associated C-terminal domain-containing protein [Saprospiraceae bacterium]|nr:gliding motility-associated C-terminal domain-containing protein [Saprospiraceae bacterium]
MIPLDSMDRQEAICAGDTIIVNGVAYTEAGMYVDTIAALTGCDTILNLSVTVYDIPEETVTTEACFGESVTVNNVTYSESGTYYDTIPGGAITGCDSTLVIEVTIHDSIPLDIAGVQLVCDGDSTVFDAGPGYVNYSWSTGATSQAITVSTEGSYSVTVTDLNGCTQEATKDLEVTGNPVVDIGGPDGFCPLQSIVLDAGSGFDGYTWTTGETSQTITVDTPGVYGVTVTLAGCTGEDSKVVEAFEVPPLVVSPDTSVCIGETVVLLAGDGFATYEWSNGDVGQATTVTNPGTYMVTATTADGCEAVDQVTVNNFADPAVDITGPLSICPGDTVLLEASSGFVDYTWSTGSTDSVIQVTAPGAYSLTVTDINGCTAIDGVLVQGLQPEQPAIAGPTQICEGASGVLTVAGTFTAYNWSTGETTPTITITTGGDYFVTVTDDNGCTATDGITVESLQVLQPDITGPDDFCEGESVILNAGPGFGLYVWNTGDSGQILQVNTGGLYVVTVTDANGCTGMDSIGVTENPLPEVTLTGPNDLCTGDFLQLSVLESYPSYLWSTGATTQSITVTTGGLYVVTVTDAEGCTSEALHLVSEHNPEVTINGVSTICQGDSAVLIATAGFVSYQWSTGATTPSIETDAAGNYGVTVTDAFGCTATAELDVTVEPNLNVIIAGNEKLCEGGDVTLSVPTGFAGYNWSTGETTNEITVDEVGTYSVTVTSAAGCTGTASVEVVESTEDPLDPVIVNPLCGEDAAILDAGPGYASYQWSDGSTTQIALVDQPGVYGITVTTADGCIYEDQLDVVFFEPIVPVINGANILCGGEPVELSISGPFNEILWSTGESSFTIEVTAGGTYSVTTTDVNGCTAESAIAINESPVPVVEIEGNPEFCADSSTTLDAGPGFASYTWSDGSNGQTLVVTGSDTYSVTVTNAAGCSAEDVFEVTERPPVEPELDPIAEVCVGGTVELDAGPGYVSYLWSTGQAGQVIEVSAAGTYTVTVVDDFGCVGEASVDVSDYEISAFISGPTGVCPGESAVLTVPGVWVSYLWSTGQTNFEITVSVEGIYRVTVTDPDGCTATGEYEFFEVPLPTPTLTGDTVICDTFEVTTLEVLENYFQYAWSTGVTGDDEEAKSIEVNQPGIYVVTVTDDRGCTATTSIQVVEAVDDLAITGPQSICIGSEGTLDAGTGYASYQWSDGSSGQTLIVVAAGIYSVTVTSQDGCTYVDSAMVDVSDELVPVISGPDVLCAGDVIVLDVGGGYTTYSWSTGASDRDIDVDSAGVYSVTVTDASGCSGETSITVGEVDPVVEIDGDPEICVGDTSVLLASPGFVSYAWSNGSNDSITIATTGDLYQVTVTDANGCTATNAFAVTANQAEVPVISGPNQICDGDVAILDAGSGYVLYQWSNGETGQVIDADTSGVYQVVVTDANGCTADASFVLAVIGSEALSQEVEICEGQTYTIGSSVYDSPGIYYDTLTSVAGCDSIVETILDVVPEIRDSTYATICDGESYPFSGGFVSIAGFYSDTLMSSGGCDSIITLDLDVIIAMDTTVTPQICEGDSIFLGGAWQTESGTYVDMLMSQEGCDSLLVTSILTVSDEIEIDVFPVLCPGDSLYGIPIFNDTLITRTFMTASGCDSTVHSYVEVGEVYFEVIDRTICEGDSVWTGSQWITQTDTITESFLTADGCDSTIMYRVLVVDTVLQIIERTICAGDSILIDGVWQTDPGIYSTTYLGPNGCDSTVVVMLETRACLVNVIGSSVPCPGDTSGNLTIEIAGLDLPVFFTWSSVDSSAMGDGVFVNYDPVTINGLGAGFYVITLQDTTGFFSQDTVQITEPSAIIATIDVNTTIDCPGSGVGFVEVDVSGGTPGYTFTWSNGATSEDPGPLGIGTYTVTITDLLGCNVIDTVTVDDSPTPEFEPFVLDVSCGGEMDGSILVETIVEVRPPYLYSIDGFTFQEDNVFNNLGAGSYTITIRDSLGCTYQLSSVIVEEPDELELYVIPRDTIELGDSVQLFVDANFDIVAIEWEPGTGLSCTDCVDPWASPKDDQVYMVTAWDENGCSAQAIVVINVRKDRNIYIPNVFSPNGDGINDFFTAYGGEQVKEIVELELFDRWGELVFRTEHIPISEPELGWDGFFRNDIMNPAVFVYVIKICWVDGYEGIFAGDVTLIR